jgi:ABC-2 type transport system ATP-binding protein
MVQLERGDGRTLFDGRPYRSLRHPLREVGLVLGPTIGDRHRTVRSHLRLALTTDRRAARDRSAAIGRFRRRPGCPATRIAAVLDIVGLRGEEGTKLGELTGGMATRLAIALALLGDPKVLLLDCPDRTLEPGGVTWLGTLLRAFTVRGRAALITGDSAETLTGLADRLLLFDTGRLVGIRTAEEVLRAPDGTTVIVRSPQIPRFAALLTEAGARVSPGEGASLEVRGLDRARVGDLAFRYAVPLHELAERYTGTDPADYVLAACSGQPDPVLPPQDGLNVRLSAPRNARERGVGVAYRGGEVPAWRMP